LRRRKKGAGRRSKRKAKPEVITPRNQKVVGPEPRGTFLQIRDEVLGTDVNIEIGNGRVSLKVEARRKRVMRVKDVGEDFGFRTQRFGSSPHKFHLLRSLASVLVLIMDTIDDVSVETHFREKGGIIGRQSKGVFFVFVFVLF